MKATLSTKDRPHLTASQIEQHRRILKALRLVQDDPVGDKGHRRIARCFFGEKELRMELFTDGHFPPQEPVGVITFLDGSRIGDRCPEPSWSRAVGRLLRPDKPGGIDPSITDQPVRHANWEKVAPDTAQRAAPVGGIVVKDDHVFVEGIKLPRYPKPGPLTPDANDVVIPKGVEKEMRVVAAALAENRPVLLGGDTGTGKTLIVTYLAYLCNVNLIKVVGDPEYSPSMFIGHLHAKAGATYWVDGDLPSAMKGVEGDGQTWLFVDELSRMLPDNTAPLLPVLERHGGKLGKLRLTDHPDPQSRVVSSHNDFRVIMAMNPFDADFVGTQEVDLALLRRCSMQIETHYPDLATTYQLLKDSHPKVSTSVLNRISKIGQKLRDERKAHRIQFPASPDVLDTWASLIDTLGFDLACEVTVLNKAAAEDRKAIEKIVNETK